MILIKNGLIINEGSRYKADVIIKGERKAKECLFPKQTGSQGSQQHILQIGEK
jgi:dihydroorotase-like cyclic amidohydrolase